MELNPIHVYGFELFAMNALVLPFSRGLKVKTSCGQYWHDGWRESFFNMSYIILTLLIHFEVFQKISTVFPFIR
ncbi:CLUMA_CG000921, isoform A [Clunio marinus]|uniref:CLUMA_CG000921, isoform A n=1 Tax=Clunio marinus TaxID=568069 RepID=A0A1J1HGW6_9DIPT|nr:CLUMA_CG000921, isoform A [Clunio marinus]